MSNRKTATVTLTDTVATLQQPDAPAVTITFDSPADLYRRLQPSYPKFYKMDALSRAAFLGAEMLLSSLCPDDRSERLDLLLFTSEGCIEADTAFSRSIVDPDNYFPSPALFVYTLPNIMVGEIAIRHRIFGETAVMMADETVRSELTTIHLNATPQRYLLTGTVDSNARGTSARLTLYYPTE